MSKYLIILLSVLLLSCGENSVAPENNISPIAKIYLNSALDIMENNSINRYEIEWTAFREKAIVYAGTAQTKEDTYDAIRFALNNLGDNHSFFREPKAKPVANTDIPFAIKTTPSSSKLSTELIGVRINSNIGFIRIPAFLGAGDEAKKFATNIQSKIRKVDSTSIKGWIVDLRQNTGGNMWPMLAGIGPILGEGLVGHFIDPDSNIKEWYYNEGKSILAARTFEEVDNYYTLYNQNPYVAVLTDNRTASSGEAIAIAFIGRPNTKSFGDHTRGLSTANRGYTLSDGAMIFLTVSTMADRNKNLYGGKIKPDVIVSGPFEEDPTNDDIVVETAIKWLESNI